MRITSINIMMDRRIAAVVCLLAAAVVAVCAQTTQFQPRFTMPTGPIVVFNGPTPGFRMFQNSSSPSFVSVLFGKLSEQDALGNSIPAHTITTLAALKPEVTSGTKMAGTTSYSFVVMKFAASALGRALTTISNCPAGLDLDLDAPAPAVPAPAAPVLTGGLLPPSAVALPDMVETVEGMEAEQAKAKAKAAAAAAAAAAATPAVGAAAVLAPATPAAAGPAAARRAAPGTLVAESAAMVPAAADVAPIVGAGGATKTGVKVFAAIPQSEEEEEDAMFTSTFGGSARRLQQVAATRATAATPAAKPAATVATTAAATPAAAATTAAAAAAAAPAAAAGAATDAFAPTITITFMFGFSENKTFPYGQGSTTVPTGAIKWTMEAANWPFCAPSNTLRLELNLDSSMTNNNAQIVMGAGDDGAGMITSTFPTPGAAKHRRSLLQGGFGMDSIADAVTSTLSLGNPRAAAAAALVARYNARRTVAKLLVANATAAVVDAPTYALSGSSTGEYNVSIVLDANPTASMSKLAIIFPSFKSLVYDPVISFGGTSDMASGAALTLGGRDVAGTLGIPGAAGGTPSMRSRRATSAAAAPAHGWVLVLMSVLVAVFGAFSM